MKLFFFLREPSLMHDCVLEENEMQRSTHCGLKKPFSLIVKENSAENNNLFSATFI